MKITISIFPIGCVLFLTACVTIDPTGPEATFLNTGPATVQATLVTDCLEEGWLVHHSSADMVMCGYQLKGKQTFFAQFLRGFGDLGEFRVRYGIVPTAEDVRIQASMWLQQQSQYGQINRPITDDQTFTDIQLRLFRLAGRDRQGRIK